MPQPTESDTKRHILFNRNLAKKLYGIADIEIQRIEKMPDSNHFGFIVWLFLNKQTEHMKSMVLLGESRDVMLIARSMLEGAAILNYVYKNDQQDLALRFRYFSAVEDCKTIRRQIAAGEVPPKKDVERTEQLLREEGSRFLTDKGHKKLQNSQQKNVRYLDLPYHNTWFAPKTLAVLIKDLTMGPAVYDHVYGSFTHYHHWTTTGLAHTMHFDPNEGYTSYRYSLTDTAQSFASVVSYLLFTMEVANDHFELGLASQLEEINAEIEAHFGNSALEESSAEFPSGVNL